jgi:MFS family permease
MTDTRDKHFILVVVVLTSLGGPLLMSAVTVALPAIASELPMTAWQMGWVSLAFTLTSAVLILTFGRLADILGRKRIFTIGVIVAAIAILLSTFSNSATMIIFLQALQGVGWAMVFSTGVALLSSAYPPGERGKVLGFHVAAVYLGLSLGPTVGGFLTQNLGWRSVFYLAAILLIPPIFLLLTRVKAEWAESKGEKFDSVGSVLFSLSIICILYGFSVLPNQLGIGIILTGAVILTVFIFWEKKANSPIININLISRNRLFVFSSLTHFLYYTGTFALTFCMSLYLQYIEGLRPQEAGLLLLIQPVVMAVFSLIAGRVSDKDPTQNSCVSRYNCGHRRYIVSTKLAPEFRINRNSRGLNSNRFWLCILCFAKYERYYEFSG